MTGARTVGRWTSTLRGREAVSSYGVPVYGRFDRPAAEAVAIRDGRVTAIGSLGEVRATMPLGTVERRLLGGALLPAFVDPHQHAYLVASDPGSDALYRQAQDIRGLVDLVARLLAEGGRRVRGGLGPSPRLRAASTR
jgi:predicted amidohydrolase YtcJ